MVMNYFFPKMFAGKDKLHSKQFTLSCTGMDYSYRQQKLLQNNEVPQNTLKGNILCGGSFIVINMPQCFN